MERLNERITLSLLKRIVQPVNRNKKDSEESIFDKYAWVWYKHCQEIKNPSSNLLAALNQLDLVRYVNTALRRKHIIGEYISELENCLGHLRSISKWAKKRKESWKESQPFLEFDTLVERYKLFKNGFYVQMPSSLSHRKEERMQMALPVFRYNMCLNGLPNPQEILSVLLDGRLSPEQVANVLRSAWPCRISLLELDPNGWQSKAAFKTEPIIVANCHQEITEKFLLIIRETSTNVNPGTRMYARVQWIHHLRKTLPSTRMMKILLEDVSSVQTSMEAKTALKWWAKGQANFNAERSKQDHRRSLYNDQTNALVLPNDAVKASISEGHHRSPSNGKWAQTDALVQSDSIKAPLSTPFVGNGQSSSIEKWTQINAPVPQNDAVKVSLSNLSEGHRHSLSVEEQTQQNAPAEETSSSPSGHSEKTLADDESEGKKFFD
ncbi:hypothetical protein GYMLUDRAFT_62959 [Collybiopsis luxurians FD-317 M1]|uniref:Uncharacterized protein n=1 Tax=Collybiopsis luxurians FD-317 M1 TaxID=944289 RepID=A0A0D0BJ02_9AGAR|nr:hypothetical protein GYMLUDRAFT_62959 [Collybiopsis luxurians FD-317 M1]